MGQVSKATRERIRERIDMVQLVGEYVQLTARGPDDQWGRCPFHEEKRPSFHIRPSLGVYKCFGCGKGGDVFRFVEEIEGVGFKDALKRLASRAGVTLETESPEERRAEERMAVLRRATDLVAGFYEQVLWSRTPAGEKGRATLARRGLSEATARAWRIGVAPDGWNALADFARERQLPVQALLDLGLLRMKDGGRPYDFFRDRLMFPIHDEQGRAVAFGGRTLCDDDRKYMNSPEIPGLYEKRRVLYGLDKARKAKTQSSKARRLIVVEGYMDVVIPHQAGRTEFVATLGTAFTTEHVGLARRYVDEVVLLFDGDAAGAAATQRALADLVGQPGLGVRVGTMPAGLDPDELVLQDPAALDRVVDAADDVIGFLIQQTLRGFDAATGAGKERALKAALRLLSRIPDDIKLFSELARISERFALPEDVLRSELRKGKSEARTEAARAADSRARGQSGAPAARPKPAKLQDDQETHVLEALLAVPDGAVRARAQGVGPEAFAPGPARVVAEAIFAIGDETGQVQAAQALGALDDPAARDLASALIGRIDATKDYARDLEGAPALLCRARERRIADLTRQIRLTKDPVRTSELLAEQQRLKTMNVEQRRATGEARPAASRA